MSNKQMTVEWLGKELELYGDPQFCKIKWEQLDSLIQQAKELEKQQIIDAFWNGDNTDCTSEQDSKEFAKKYFKETYEQ
jgi:hypothetical protein